MLRFFRQIRQKLLENGNIRKYFWYALGEILLVMIGILLALQVNNWNEAKKTESIEIKILQELLVALENDSSNVVNLFEPRMLTKENTIDSLLMFIELGTTLGNEKLSSFYERLGTDFLYRFNAGPYQTIKSNGLSIISNQELRSSITSAYETTLPAFKEFIEIVYDESMPVILDLEPDFVTNKIEWHEDHWHNLPFPKGADMLINESFYKVLGLQVEIARNNRNRIDFIKIITAELRDEIRQELKARGY